MIDYQLVMIVKWFFDMFFEVCFLVIYEKKGIDYQLVMIVKWKKIYKYIRDKSPGLIKE